jgi:WD40-like Beta Propeller Repeat
MRNRIVLAALVVGACARTPAPTPPQPTTTGAPSTDIYVYRLGRSLLPFRSRLSNVTHRPGYDNQPFWDGASMLFSSVRDGQADIYRFAGDTVARVTSTPESEYSPALTPDGNAISVVRVERDSTQRLWRFPLAGGQPTVILPNLKPVGYYAWLDTAAIALYVLGNPDTLEIADVHSGRASVVTTDIGRSLQRVPGSTRVSFVRRENDRWVLKTASAGQGGNGDFDVTTVATLPDGAEYVAWRSSTELYTASGSRLYRLRLPARNWEEIADLARNGLSRITRLSVSPDGRSLAIVAEDRP